ncbi:MAG: hypothetical protein JWN27_393 [Candidatus Eremiobacteraeota bacterium]|nr:hypothetical protein [Candidatus Eremiobacteraeota bacterium]
MQDQADPARLRERLSALHRIVARSTGSVERDRQALLAEAMTALGLDFGSVAQFRGGVAYPIASLNVIDEPNQPINYPTPVRELLANAVYERSATIAVADLRSDPEFADHVQVRERNVARYVGTPIRVAGDDGYVLTMGGRLAQAHPFADDDLAYVELLAALFAQSLRDEMQERSIERLAFHCRLTGLPMEERLRERCADLAAARRPFALVALHVDIGGILAKYDHSRGAGVVAATARRIEGIAQGGRFATYRGVDVDFFLVGDAATPADAEALAEAIRSAFATPFVLDGREIVVSPALGIAMARDGEPAAATLLRAIDAARDAQARTPAHRTAPHADGEGLRRRRLLDDLRGVAERDELVLHFQPVVTVADGAICGVEALVRWQHPVYGLLPPDSFIPLAEENDSVVALGMWVMRRAARLARQLADTGYGVSVAVNVASAQLQDTAFIDRLRFATREAGVPPSALELEITETAALRDLAAVTAVLSECRALGVRVALDDFGTGYSSLSYLRDLPSDIVKIDRSFIAALEYDARATAIASATIVLAHRLGRVVQAEGVETQTQRAWLRDERCDRAQGYLYGRPDTQEALLRLLAG